MKLATLSATHVSIKYDCYTRRESEISENAMAHEDSEKKKVATQKLKQVK